MENQTPKSFEQQSLEAELESSRENEARYRKLAKEAHEQSQRLRQMTLTLGELSQSKVLAQQGLIAALEEILQRSSECLGVTRAGIWVFQGDPHALYCLAQCPASSLFNVLQTSQTPAYFMALQDAVVIAAHNIYTDPRTKELGDYARQQQIGALLDAPLRVFGEMVGVVCHEHSLEERQWLAEEEAFAAAIGDLIALALTTQKQQAATLSAAASEAKYRGLVESLPIVIYASQPNSAALNYVSPQIFELSGISTKEWYTRGGLPAWLEIVHPSDLRLVEERVKRGMLVGNEPDMEYRILHKNGDWRWIRDSCRTVRNVDGKPIGLQGILQDITSQREIQDAKQEAERRFYDLLTQGQLLAFTLNEQGQITFINDTLCALLDRSRDQLVGNDWFDLTLPVDERQAARELLFFGNQLREQAAFELSLLTPEGRLVVRWAVTPLLKLNGASVGVACIGMDLTVRLQTESRMRELQKNESLARLAAGAAHDINNVLTSLGGVLSTFQDPNSNQAELKESATELQRCIQRATEFTSSLLRFARQHPSQPSSVMIDPFLESSAELLQMLLGRSVELTFSLHAPGATTWIDPTQLQQVILNIATNAHDAMPNGGFLRLSSEEVFLDEDLARETGELRAGAYIKIQCKDSGVGVLAADLPRVFDPSFTTKGDRNTGLGLSVSYGVVRQMGGHILMQSKQHRGTNVILYLAKLSVG
jgi:PAS domain S-box-containing protein